MPWSARIAAGSVATHVLLTRQRLNLVHQRRGDLAQRRRVRRAAAPTGAAPASQVERLADADLDMRAPIGWIRSVPSSPTGMIGAPTSRASFATPGRPR